ncbi:NAD-dependent epimerase/dehydratase family protein [Bradymonas sediminis]|uniref:Uncharacterized protein n=1 Tax=Bradymonas sediminis TaxID=1548548 RepID=A0A2Z4FMN8_9DELT|nr:NAD(P)-dependent oxidoreductase [Bradymonas sediminis]AWV90026.1 hypothetical protein DN745_12020 [Bradymonas sediminis]TDP76016.1 nucleoside-diphosphate-sugar epimerase [Bradymonas sediminis]
MTDKSAAKTSSKAGKTVLVTGAAGGVGRHVVRAALDAGMKVRAADRFPAADALEVDGLFDPLTDVDWRFAELSAADLDALTQGCDFVIHAAAIVSLSESYTELAGVNVQLVRDLYRASQANGVAHFVHFSCGAIYEAGPGFRNESDRLSASNAFEQSKIDSEQVFPHQPETTHWSILRPALVYGPHCTKMGASITTLPPLVRDIMPYLPGITGGPRTNWCYVEDAASAALCVLDNPAAFERTFNVADDTALGFGEVVTSITEAYRLEVGALVPFPNTTLWTALSPLIDHDIVFDIARKILRRRWRRLQEQQDLNSPLRPRVDRNALFYVEKDNILGADALKELGWAARYTDFREGIVETIRWYQAHDWAPRFDTETQVRIQDEKQSLGFAFRTRFEGQWVDEKTGDTAPVTLLLQTEFPTITRLALDLEGNIDGKLSIGGLVEDAEIRGTIQVRLLSEGGVYWEMGFDDAQGNPHRLGLSCSVNPLRPLDALTHVSGDIKDANADVVGHVELSYHMRSQLLPSMATFRLLH